MIFRAALYKGTHPGLPGVFNRFVRWRERGIYSHMELVFSDGVAASSSFMDGGVRFKRIQFDEENWDFIELPAHLESAAREWFVKHNGQPYDLRADICLGFGALSQRDGAWMCSESGMAALGVDENDAWRFDPNAAAAILRRIWK